MIKPITVNVTVPATTANLGPGFDCIGAALTLYNQFKFTCVDENSSGLVGIKVNGAEAHSVKTDESNLLYQTFIRFYQGLGHPPPLVELEIDLGVPLARGLGSSATAIVGGLVGANYLAGSPWNQQQLMELAIAVEGHPDNVVPALLGGCRLAASRGDELPKGWEVCEVIWHTDTVPVVAIPNFELSTQAARQVLPLEVSRADAIFNVAHLGLLLRGLETAREDWLRVALADRLHQPYRQALIHGYAAVRTAAMAAGALGVVISGAGPTLLALVKADQAVGVARAMEAAWRQEGIEAQVRALAVDFQGTKISRQGVRDEG